MGIISDLWTNKRLPIDDALHFPGSGESYDVEIDPDAPGGLRILKSCDVEEMLAEDPDWTSDVEGMTSKELADGGRLWGGEGSYGSEGFFARVRADGALIWAVFFADSNPFLEIELTGDEATFRSTSGVVIKLNIDDPLRSLTPPS